MAPDGASWLSPEDYLAAFGGDTARFGALLRGAATDALVPTCPTWTSLDLARHVGDVYSHKIALLRLGRQPAPGEWLVGDGLDLVAAVDRHDALAVELAGLLAQADPRGPAWTWMEGDGEGTVGAWVRRMAHEALVHRVDAEAVLGQPLRPGAPGLAVDGLNEVLTWMAGDPDIVADPRGAVGHPGTVLLDYLAGGWLVELVDGDQRVRAVEPAVAADVVLRGDPLALDLELWGRLSSLPESCRGDLDAVSVTGDQRVLERLRARIALATQ